MAFDLIFAGGGLASSLCAFRLKQRRPELKLLVLEQGLRLGGSHTWSFFPTDLEPEQMAWVAPFIAWRWPAYEVHFPGRRRRLSTGYCATDSAHLHEQMQQALGDGLRLNAKVRSLKPGSAELDGGETLEARAVIDGRGPAPSPHLLLGYQKFTGLVLNLAQPHGLANPIVMDARVPQQGDYRFFYLLPLGPARLLAEDTRYSDSPRLDGDADAAAIADYAEARGWRIRSLARREQGVLPVALGGDIQAFWAQAGETPRIGLRAALFHATTGYSFPDAVRTADALAEAPDLSAAALRRLLAERSARRWREQAYLRLLNRMLFLAAAPDGRRQVLERFYGLPQGLIERFYAGRLKLRDRLRILAGRPPVPVLRALRCLPERSALGPGSEGCSRLGQC